MAITIPNTFVAGTKIEATPMNANFAETANAVDKRGDTLTGNLGANAGITVDGIDLSTIPNTSGTFNPLFAQVVIGTADTNGIRLDLESGTLAVREGDDSAYGPLITSVVNLPSTGSINFASSDVTLTHSTNTLTFAGAASGYIFNDGGVGIGMTPTYRLDITGVAGSVVARFNQATAGKTGVLFAENGTQRAFLSQVGLYSGNSDGNFGIFVETGYNFQIATNGSTTAKLTVDTSGNVGLGVTPSAWDSTRRVLQIGGSGSLWTNTSGMGFFFMLNNAYYDGTNYKYLNTDEASYYAQTTAGAHSFATAASGTAGNNVTFTERFHIDNSGNVGIGVTPASILHLRGSAPTLTLDDSGNTITTISYRPAAASYAERGAVSWNVTTGEMRISAGASGGSFFQTFYTNGTERLRIDTSGNVGIGVTPGSVRLDIVGSTDAIRVTQSTTNATSKDGKYLQRHYTNSEEDLLVAYSYSTSTDNGLAFGGGSGAQNAATLIGFYTAANNTTVSGTERLRINNSGHVGIGATARFYLDGVAGTGDTYIAETSANVLRLYAGGTDVVICQSDGLYLGLVPTTASAANMFFNNLTARVERSTSSLRYKHDIDTLDTTDALAAVMAMRPVTYRGKTDEDQRRFVGFIAEEMQEIAPLLCTYDDGGESGTPNYVTYDRVTAYLVAVVQQQQQKIAALEARIH